MPPAPNPPLDPWEPLAPADAAALFRRLTVPWWVAGGIAIEMAVGRSLRSHGDLDIQLLHRDRSAVRHALPGWELWAADPPGRLRPWPPGEPLAPHVHDVWCRPGPGRPWALQVMLDDAVGATWVSRRDPRIRRPITSLRRTGPGGIPFLAPEVQLFYKARDPRPKDEADFTAVLPVPTGRERRWLARAVTRTLGPHPWADRLRRGGPPA